MATIRNLLILLVPLAGLEPARPCGQQILSLPRLPISPQGRASERAIGSSRGGHRGQAAALLEGAPAGRGRLGVRPLPTVAPAADHCRVEMSGLFVLTRDGKHD